MPRLTDVERQRRELAAIVAEQSTPSNDDEPGWHENILSLLSAIGLVMPDTLASRRTVSLPSGRSRRPLLQLAVQLTIELGLPAAQAIVSGRQFDLSAIMGTLAMTQPGRWPTTYPRAFARRVVSMTSPHTHSLICAVGSASTAWIPGVSPDDAIHAMLGELVQLPYRDTFVYAHDSVGTYVAWDGTRVFDLPAIRMSEAARLRRVLRSVSAGFPASDAVSEFLSAVRAGVAGLRVSAYGRPWAAPLYEQPDTVRALYGLGGAYESHRLLRCDRCRFATPLCTCTRPRIVRLWCDNEPEFSGDSDHDIPRYVGMEIEVCGVRDDDARTDIVDLIDELGGCIKRDGSLPDGGFEITLPPIRGARAVEVITRVGEALAAAGAYVTNDAGGHVHVDNRAASAVQGSRLLALWSQVEHYVERTIAAGRFTRTSYSRAVTSRAGPINENWLASICDGESGDILAACTEALGSTAILGERYVSLNLLNTGWRRNYYQRDGAITGQGTATVEFRLFPGAVSTSRLLMHARLASRLVATAYAGGPLFEGAMRLRRPEDAVALAVGADVLSEMQRLGSPPPRRRTSERCGAAAVVAAAPATPQPVAPPVAPPVAEQVTPPEPTPEASQTVRNEPYIINGYRLTAYARSRGAYVSTRPTTCNCDSCIRDRVERNEVTPIEYWPAFARPAGRVSFAEFPNDGLPVDPPF